MRHGEALQQLFVQVLGVLAMKGLIALERVTVDGTRVRVCVNKKTFSRADKIHEHLKVVRCDKEAARTWAAKEPVGRRA